MHDAVVLQNGDISTAASIAQKFKADKADLVVGIGTPVAQALANVFTTTPAVFDAL
jgi:putative tryptophan/tyrosine transport system substrate-binding protein